MGMEEQMNKIVLLVEKDSKKLRKYLYGIVSEYYIKKYGVSDKEIEIKRGSRGKPYITIQGRKLYDFFNISHTSDVGVVVFSNYEIGIDIERIEKPGKKIAHRFFHENEKKYLESSVNEPECRKRFYEIWTKKEAYLKWNGTGLTDGLSDLDVLAKKYAFQCIEIDGKEYALAIYGQWK